MSLLKQSLSLKAALLLLAALIARPTVVYGQVGQGYSKCIQTKDEFMSYTVTGGDINDDPRNHLLCECRGTSDDGDYMLLCSLYDEWDFCAGTEPVCASILFGQTFDTNGQVMDRFRNYDYVDERLGTVTVQRIPTTASCVVTVNSDQCNSCEIVDYCSTDSQLDSALYERGLPSAKELGIFTDLKVNCTNINSLATFECGVADGEGNFLHILNGYPVPSPQTIDTTITPVTQPTAESMASSISNAPSTSSAPSEVVGMPSTILPSMSALPSVSNPPSGVPTITASPNLVPEPSSVESMKPTKATVSVTFTGAEGSTSSQTSSTVILFFFSAIVSFLLLTQ
jgi:hypothetical protein